MSVFNDGEGFDGDDLIDDEPDYEGDIFIDEDPDDEEEVKEYQEVEFDDDLDNIDDGVEDLEAVEREEWPLERRGDFE